MALSRPNSPGLLGLNGTEATSFSVSAAFTASGSLLGGGDGFDGALAVLRDAAFAGDFPFSRDGDGFFFAMGTRLLVDACAAHFSSRSFWIAHATQLTGSQKVLFRRSRLFFLGNGRPE